MSLVPDPRPTPEEALAASEERIPIAETGSRRPRNLLGMSLIPWPGPPPRRSRVSCPSCGSLPLDLDTYCLLCDRWGRDLELTGYDCAKLDDAIIPGNLPGRLLAPKARERRRVNHNLRMDQRADASRIKAKARAKARKLARSPFKVRRDGAASTPFANRAPSAN